MAKYKLKTHKATAKRFKITGTGKIMRRKMSKRHNSHLKNKSKSQRKLVPEAFIINSSGNIKRVKRLLNS
jgi:large subunit ribosomal protein L35